MFYTTCWISFAILLIQHKEDNQKPKTLINLIQHVHNPWLLDI